MALYPIVFPRHTWQRPPWPCQIDWAKPITRDLVFAGPTRMGVLDASPIRDYDAVRRTPMDVTLQAGRGGKPDPILGSYINSNGTTIPTQFTLSMPSTNNLTQALWVRPNAVGSYMGLFISRSSGFSGLLLSGAASNPVTMDWNNASYNEATGLFLTLSVWQLVVGVHQGATNTVYLFASNGAMSSYSFAVTDTARTLPTWGVGADSGGAAFNGDYANPAMWTRALSLGEVQSLYDPMTRWDCYRVPERRAWVNIAAAAGVVGQKVIVNQAVTHAANY